MLKLLMPSIRIWLDVDNFDDVGKLEASVNMSASFIIFLSKGYFASYNCRRELYTALGFPKPLISVWEADENKGGATLEQLAQEVRDCWDENEPSADEVLMRVLDDEENVPIPWVHDPSRPQHTPPLGVHGRAPFVLEVCVIHTLICILPHAPTGPCA